MQKHGGGVMGITEERIKRITEQAAAMKATWRTSREVFYEGARND